MKRRRQLTPIYIVMGIVGALCILTVAFFYFRGQKFKEYSNLKLGFSIQYPSSWLLEENKEGAAVVFYSPKSNALDLFQENVNIVVQDLDGSMTLDEYTKTAVDQLKAVFQQNADIQESKEIKISGREGYKIVFIGKGDNTQLKYLCAWTIVGNQAYQITFTAMTPADFDKYISFVNGMFKSFKFLSKSS